MHGELRLAIDRLRLMPKSRVWFIPVLLNETDIPTHSVSDHETLRDINAIRLYEDWDKGLQNILRAMTLNDPAYRRALHFLDLIRYHPAERMHAVEQLAHIANLPPDTLQALGEALRDADSEVRRLAADAHERFGATAVPALVAALKDTDAGVRCRAAEALGRIGPAAAEAAPALVAALKDTDAGVRCRAAEALGRIGPAGAEAVPGLIGALNDSDALVRRCAADALAELRPSRASKQSSLGDTPVQKA
jgi:HEAT repeats